MGGSLLTDIHYSRLIKTLKYTLLFFAWVWANTTNGQVADTLLPSPLDTTIAVPVADSSGNNQLNASNSKTPVNRFKISGLVKDKKTGQPIPFATIFFPKSPIGIPGDDDGKFLLEFNDFPGDTLKVQAIGYIEYSLLVDKSTDSQDIIIELVPSATQLDEVVIRPYEDPIKVLFRKIVARKPINNPAKFENYTYESYNKVEIDVMNLTKQEFEKLPIPYLKHFSFIYDNIDSSSGTPILPFYLTETVSDYYYQEKPRRTKEFIKASRIKGINNAMFTKTMTTYLGNMFLVVNPYDNYMQLFDKKYVSPISNNSLAFYKYTIIDTQIVDGYDVFNIHFEPLRQGENCFEGSIGIVDSFFALQYISAEVPKEANLNWIKNAKFYKTYSLLGDSLWFCTKENTTADLQALADFPYMPSLRAIRTNSYKNIRVNEDTVKQIVSSPDFKLDVVIAEGANEQSDEFWEQSRHEDLSKNEKAIYQTFDSIQNSEIFNKFKSTLRFLVAGVVRTGPVEFGPYWNVISSNNIEGRRIQLQMGTNLKFSKSLYLTGYFAYGTLDQKPKYRGEALWLFRKEFPRSYLYGTYTHDIDRTVNYYDNVNYINIFSIRKPDIPLKAMFTNDARLEYMKEYYSGFSHMFTLLHKEYEPYLPLPGTNIFSDYVGNATGTLKQTEFNVRLRYAYKERFMYGNYYRLSLGSKYPIVEMRYGVGIKGFLDGAYDYHRLTFSVSDNIRIPPAGMLYMNIFAGKYWGTLPYPLLQLHPGNETYIYNKYAFSMMTQYEFISDQYAGISLEHSLGGCLFNYVPLLKKLKFRQFWTAKAVIGSLNDSNRALNFNKGVPFRTLESNPYIEIGTGVENILRLFRVDFVWRVAPKRLPTEAYNKYFGVFGSVKVAF